MKIINVKMHGDVVYWLSSSGFKKGIINKAVVKSDKDTGPGKYDIYYYCTCPEYDSVYMGDSPSVIFDTWESMINYYAQFKPK